MPPGPTPACKPARASSADRRAGLALGYVQANLVVVPRDLAFDFLLFCQRNPKPCPLLDVTEPGSRRAAARRAGCRLAHRPAALSRLPPRGIGRRAGRPDRACWRDDLVAFLLGCSFTFENALLASGRAGAPHRDRAAMCRCTALNIACRPAGVFDGPMVVSMRPMTPAQAVTATHDLRSVPAGPRDAGPFRRSAALGIRDLDRPDFGDRGGGSARARCRSSGRAA